MPPARAPKYWLMKTEPNAYSIDDLAKEKGKTTHWDGVRNYQARNFMRDEMTIGDQVLLYHSNAKPPGVVGICKVVKESYPDFTAFDPKDKYYDPKSKQDSPTWFMVDIKLVKNSKRKSLWMSCAKSKRLMEWYCCKRVSTFDSAGYQKTV